MALDAGATRCGCYSMRVLLDAGAIQCVCHSPRGAVRSWRSLLQAKSTRMRFKIICEIFMKIRQIFMEIWAHLFLRISLKIAKLRYRHY